MSQSDLNFLWLLFDYYIIVFRILEVLFIIYKIYIIFIYNLLNLLLTKISKGQIQLLTVSALPYGNLGRMRLIDIHLH